MVYVEYDGESFVEWLEYRWFPFHHYHYMGHLSYKPQTGSNNISEDTLDMEDHVDKGKSVVFPIQLDV